MVQENLLYDLLLEIFPRKKILREYTFSNGLRLDFYLPELNLAIEYDGIQHRQFVDFYYKHKADFYLAGNRDEQKEYICEQLGINVVHFSDQDKLTKELVEARCYTIGFGTGIITEDGEQYINKKVLAKLVQKTVRKNAYDKHKSSEFYKSKLKQAKNCRKKMYEKFKDRLLESKKPKNQSDE